MKKLILIVALAVSLFANKTDECIYNANTALEYQDKAMAAIKLRNSKLLRENIDATVYYLEKALVTCEIGTKHHDGIKKAYEVFSKIQKDLKK